MGYLLYREVRDFHPRGWSKAEYLVALMIADDANDQSRRSWIPHELLAMRTDLGDRGLRAALQGLGDSGYEFRVIHGYGNDSRPVFASRGHAVDYVVPDLIKGGTAVPPIGPVDNSKGGMVVPPISAETDKKGGTAVPKGGMDLSKGGTAVPPLSSISSVSPQRPKGSDFTPTVERARASRQVKTDHDDEAERGRQLEALADWQRNSPIAAAAWKAVHTNGSK